VTLPLQRPETPALPGLAAGFGVMLRRDLQLAWRRRGQAVNPLIFFAMVTALVPLAEGPEPALLARLAPGMVWIMALLGALLAADALFHEDFADGALEHLVLSPQPLWLLVLAKVIASLDSLSDGRFALGVGIGWAAEEFAALGIPFERRGQRTCEYIEAMRALWSDEKSSYHGEFVRFDEARCFPKPVQGGKVPVIFGGESMPALRRVARFGTGWFGVNLNPDQAAVKIAKLHALLDEQGRDRKEVEIIISPYANRITLDDLRAYHELGVSEFVPFVRLPGDDAMIPAALEQVAREWVEPAARLG
jgi:probable F420-dependent oxidoreductase